MAWCLRTSAHQLADNLCKGVITLNVSLLHEFAICLATFHRSDRKSEETKSQEEAERKAQERANSTAILPADPNDRETKLVARQALYAESKDRAMDAFQACVHSTADLSDQIGFETLSKTLREGGRKKRRGKFQNVLIMTHIISGADSCDLRRSFTPGSCNQFTPGRSNAGEVYVSLRLKLLVSTIDSFFAYALDPPAPENFGGVKEDVKIMRKIDVQRCYDDIMEVGSDPWGWDVGQGFSLSLSLSFLFFCVGGGWSVAKELRQRERKMVPLLIQRRDRLNLFVSFGSWTWLLTGSLI